MKTSYFSAIPNNIKVIILLVILLQVHFPLQAEHRIVRVGLFPAPPLVQIEKNVPSGLFIDLINYFAVKLDWNIQYIEKPWNELLKMLENGEIDLLPAISYTIERTAIYDFSQHPVYIDSGVLFTNPKFTIHTIFDLQDKRVAGVKGSLFTDRFIEYLSTFGINCEIVYYNDNQTVMKEISQGNVEAGVCIYSLGTELSKQYKVIITPISFSPLALEFAVPKGKNADILTGINRLMMPMLDDSNSFYTKSFEKWTFPSHSFKIPFWLELVLIILLLVGIFLFFLTLLLRRIVLVKTNSLRNEIVERIRAEEKIKQNLQEKETLLRELYHRTKNTIQVIRGMLILQADSYPENEQIKDLVKQTEIRIQTISLVHQMLYQSNDLSSISIKTYCNELTTLIMQGFFIIQDNITLELNIQDKYILLDIAIPLGLVITELMTNSLKYAFPNQQPGKIRISLHISENNRYLMQYSDNGVGIPDTFNIKNSTTLGFKLINDIIEQQLNGQIMYEKKGGFSCTAEFPENLYQARV